jgi:hypothetical protein
MDGLSTSWIPYGGGQGLCSGHHFANQEIILMAAVFLAVHGIRCLRHGEFIEEKGKKGTK